MKKFGYSLVTILVTFVYWLLLCAAFLFWGLKALVNASWLSVFVVFVIAEMAIIYARHLWAYAIAMAWARSGESMAPVYVTWIPTLFFGIVLLRNMYGVFVEMHDYANLYSWANWAMAVVFSWLILSEMINMLAVPFKMRNMPKR